MQIDRLFGIVYLLLNQKKATAKELAERFEVSVRTIMRDIDTLSQAGIPVCTEPGRGGGVSIMDHFVLNKAAISDEEQNQILFALQSFGSAGHMEVKDIVSKLQNLFDKTGTNWIEVELSRWGNIKQDNEKFDVLKQAVIGKRAISFDYPGSGGVTAGRTVYPLKLVFKSRDWYLQAYCLNKLDYRTFKVNRILSLKLLDEGFEDGCFSPPPIDMVKSLADGLVHLVLEFPGYAAHRIYDEFDLENIVQNADGSFLVTVDLPNDGWLYSFLLSFGDSVRVVEPERVRGQLLKEAGKILKQNKI